MAYDVQRFNELTKQMSAYAHVTRVRARRPGGGAGPAPSRAARARRADQPAAARSGWRARRGCSWRATCSTASTPAHQAAGRRLYAAAEREAAWQQREQRVAAGQDPGALDGRYRAAVRHAIRWGLPEPRWDTEAPA